VFFNRFGKQTPLSLPTLLASEKTAPALESSRKTVKNKDDGAANIVRRRAVAVAMAVQLSLPFGLMSRMGGTAKAAGAGKAADDSNSVKGKTSFEALFGCKPSGLPALSASAGAVAAQPFNKAVEQIQAGEFETAVTTLQDVPVNDLGDADSKLVDDLVTKTRFAAREQRTARNEYVLGTEASARHQFLQATNHFRKVTSNGFADAHTQQVAATELAYADASTKSAGQPINADVTPATPPATGTQLAQATTPTAPAEATPKTPAAATPPAAPAPAPAPMPAPAPAPAPVATGEDSGAMAALEAAARVKAIEHQKDAYDAEKLVEKARGEQNAGQSHEALNDYSQAVKLDPTNEQAKAGQAEMQSLLNVGVSNRTGSEGQVKEIQEEIQKIQYQFDSSIQDADNDIDAGKFPEAQKAIESAQVAAQENPNLFTLAQINNFNTRLQQARLRLETAQANAQQNNITIATANAAKTEEQRKIDFEKDRERTISNLIQDARQYEDEGKYIEALAVIDNIQKLDPTNKYAGDTRQFVEDKANNQTQRKWREEFDANLTKQYNRAVEENIPYEDIVTYSADWPKISEERDEEVKEDRGEDTEDAALQAQLDRHLPELRFNANGLSDVIEFLRDVTGANIYVDWAALERASIAKDAPVTARLRDIKFSKALELIFKSVEGEDDDHKLGYTLDEGVITISTKKELNKNTVTRRYDINDLLFVAPDYTNAPQLSLQTAGQGQTAGGGGGGAQQGQGLFNNTGGQQNPQQQGQDRANRVDEIKKYITDNVDTNTWKDNGGDVGSISSSPLRAVLLITQTPEAQRKIQSVLDSLRASQALQVSVETRFLVVQRNYLEDIGVNVDFEFNPLQNPANARSGYNSSRFTPISITQTAVTNNTTFTDANGNTVANSSQGSRTLDWISNVGNAAVPGSIPANPADYPNPLVISGSYVDNMTVNFLIRAVQANQNTTSLTAPRLTLFSGQTALLVVETQQAYVSNLTPVVAPGAALFDPQVSTTTAEGVVLSVQATVSPDRKYVFMNLQPQLARLRALVPFSISAVVTPVTGSVLTPTTPQIVSGTLQLPTIDVTLVQTSVSVPDGATLLLGGQTLAAETTREQGVPVLSKIPFLKRLFTNRATAQDEQILLILVRPTILIQREQELKQFPQLSAKLGS
jgi:type II secretory pathway component GspD/PulD (secretin)/tetratricopeptide (TPR) repeat protein